MSGMGKGTERKRCKGCGNSKLLEEFPKHSKTKDKRDSKCRECRNSRRRKHPKPTDDAPLISKRCTRCGEEKPLREFYKNNRSRYGRLSYCKACKKELYLLEKPLKLNGHKKSKSVRKCVGCGGGLTLEDIQLRAVLCNKCLVEMRKSRRFVEVETRTKTFLSLIQYMQEYHVPDHSRQRLLNAARRLIDES